MFISVRNLEKSYGDTKVLRRINLSIEKSSECTILGESGSGKSTLLYILGGLEKPDSGELIVDGQNISELSDEDLSHFRNKQIGFVFQFHFLLASMTCMNNILLPAKIGKYPVKEVKKRAREFADLLKVGHCLDKYPFQLSGGEQQRINIIRAISLNPSILLCDEPTGNLDSSNTEKVLSLLRSLASQIGSTLIMVTHDVKVSQSFDRKITIEDGQIVG